MRAYPELVSHRLVQGEAMRQSEIMKKKTRFPALILFLCGFLAGNLMPNILWKIKWQQKTLASIYFLSIFATGNISGTEYLKELIKIRGSLFILSVLCGFSIFGVPLAVAGMLFLGFLIGAVAAMSILQFGFAGGLIGAGLLLPQYLFYIPVWMYLMEQVWELSLGIWRNKGLFPGRCRRYLISAGIALLVYAAGILTECYINPWIAEKLLTFVDFF